MSGFVVQDVGMGVALEFINNGAMIPAERQRFSLGFEGVQGYPTHKKTHSPSPTVGS